MTGTSLQGTGLCESKSADICLMTKIVNFLFTLKTFVFNLPVFKCVAEGTLNVTLVKFSILFIRKVCF